MGHREGFYGPLTHPPLRLLHGQLNPVLLHQFSEVDQGIPHPPEGCIDGDPGALGNLAEAQVFFDPHEYNFALFFWKLGNECPHIPLDFALNQCGFDMGTAVRKSCEYIELIG